MMLSDAVLVYTLLCCVLPEYAAAACAVLAPCCAVDLHAGVYYQKCYDPECRHYRSNTMPLPGNIWQAYRHLEQQPGQQDQHVQDHHQRRQQQQAPSLPVAQQLQAVRSEGAAAAAGEDAAQASAAADGEEDEGYLRLLLQCEQQRLQPPPQHPPEAKQGAAGCADDVVDVDTADDELYMQLLQAVEQQHVAQQGHQVAAS